MEYKDFENCGLKKSLDMISGKWKPPILYYLFHQKEIRFNALWRSIPRVSKKVLTEQLRQLEDDGLIDKRTVDAFPTQVYYRLSFKGQSLGEALEVLDKFGRE